VSNDLPDPIRQLRGWQRFHFRVTLLYGLAVYLVLTALAVVAYAAATTAARDALGRHLLSTAEQYATGIDAEQLAASVDDPSVAAAQQARLQRWFEQVGDERISSVYVLLHDDDPAQLRFFVDWAVQDPASPGEIYDATELLELQQGFHEALIESTMTADEWGLSQSAYAPIPHPDGGPLALVGVDVAADDVRAAQRQVLLLTAVTWLASGLLIGVVSLVVGRNVREPLTRVIDATAAIARGRFDTRLQLARDDEFGLMARYFDRMAEGLAEREVIRETFGRYVAPDVARTLLQDGARLGGERRDVTVLFTDLAGYSTISEALQPDQVVSLSNAYLGAMQVAIDAEGGTVIEFLGDAILAVFGAPTRSTDHADRAVRCALAMREQLAALNEASEGEGVAELWRNAGVERLAHRVGLHTGSVIAGNIGSTTRMKYAVVGDAVNVAARLEQLNKTLQTEVLLSSATLGALSESTREQAHPARVGELPVKGRQEPVEVYSI
jgi:adenylate cyclase